MTTVIRAVEFAQSRHTSVRLMNERSPSEILLIGATAELGVEGQRG